MLHHYIEGEKVGEDRGDDDGPWQRSGANGSKGREPPFFFFFLDLLPRWEKVSPLVLGSHVLGGARAPSRLDLSLCFPLFLRSLLALFHSFVYIWRSVTPIGLKPSP